MIIYKITNKANGKIYVGQTIKTIKERWNKHCRPSNLTRKFPLTLAIEKYGKNSFIIEQIDTAKTAEELNEKEAYWIRFFNSTVNGYGYNATLGGDKLLKKINQIPILCLTNGTIYESQAEACKQLQLDSANLSKVLRGIANQTKGFDFEYVGSDKERLNAKKYLKKKQRAERVRMTRSRMMKELYVIGKLGTFNPTAKPITIFGIDYPTMKAASQATGLSLYKIRQLRTNLYEEIGV